jgi:hypothetical protein
MLSKSLLSLCFEENFFTQRCMAANVVFWKPAPAPTATVTMKRALVYQHKLTLHPLSFGMHRF